MTSIVRTPHPAARRSVQVTAVAAVAVVLLAGAATASVRHISGHADLTQLNDSAMRAASRFATDFSTYDYRHIDADFARVAADATGSFKRDFLVQSAGARDLLVKAKAVSNTEVVRVATVTVNGSSAEILVALNRTVFNTQVPNGRTDAMGLDVTLVRRGTGWLASGVKPL
jgi:hypothetical protein